MKSVVLNIIKTKINKQLGNKQKTSLTIKNVGVPEIKPVAGPPLLYCTGTRERATYTKNKQLYCYLKNR